MLARAGLIIVGGAVAVTTVLGAAPVAAADHDEAIRCDYRMTDPTVVDVNGVAMVMATLDPAGCTGDATPNFTQVCLSTPGNAGRCAQLPGFDSPTVYLSPYIPGTTYTARGLGCAAVASPPQPICTAVGPRSVTL